MANNFINQLLAANASKNVSLPNPAGMLHVANQAIDSGFTRLQKVGEAIKRKRIDSDVAAVLGKVDQNQDPVSYRNQLFSEIAQIPGVSAADAIGLAKKLSYTDENVYGVTTDDLGNVWKYNKQTGELDPIQGGYTWENSPKSITLKTVTDRDENGREITRQVPVNKYTGQHVSAAQPQSQPTQTDYQLAVDFLRSKGLTEEQYKALPEEERAKLDAEFETYAPAGPTVTANSSTGVKIPQDSAAQTKQVEETSALIGPFKRIKETYDPKFVGPFDARWQGAKSNLGVGETDFNTFQANLRQMTNITRHALFGGALTEHEIAEWNRAAPVDTANETEFVPKYNAFIDMSIDKMRVAKQRYVAKGAFKKAAEVQAVIDQMQNEKLPIAPSRKTVKDPRYGDDFTVIKF